jgi:hypothetical protein
MDMAAAFEQWCVSGGLLGKATVWGNAPIERIGARQCRDGVTILHVGLDIGFHIASPLQFALLELTIPINRKLFKLEISCLKLF